MAAVFEPRAATLHAGDNAVDKVTLDLSAAPLPEADAAARRRRRVPADPAYSRLNDRMAVLLIAMVTVAPLPVGSNRPAWWLIWAAVIAVAALVHLILGRTISRDRPLRITADKPVICIAFIVPIWALLQTLPVADMLPGFLVALPDQVPHPATISLAPSASLVGVVRSFSFVLFFVLVVEVASQKKRMERLAYALFFSVAFQAVLGLVFLNILDDFALWGDKTSNLGMATGGFINRNSFATFLGFGLVQGIALALDRNQRPRIRQSRAPSRLSAENLETAVLWLLVGLILLALISTQSRLGTAASLLGAAVTFAMMRAKSSISPRRLMTEVAGIVLAALALAGSIVGTGLFDRLLLSEAQSGTRLEIYRQTWAMIMQRPLTGFGWDAFGPAFQLVRHAPLLGTNEIDLAHNTYLTFWAELGLVFGSLPLLGLGLLFWRCVQNFRNRDHLAGLPAAAIGVLVVGAVHSLGDFSLEIAANVLMFAAVIALGMARDRGEWDGEAQQS